MEQNPTKKDGGGTGSSGGQQKDARPAKPDKDPEAEKAAGKQLTAEEKRAQRDAKNKAKAAAKEAAKLKKQGLGDEPEAQGGQPQAEKPAKKQKN